MSQFRKLGKNQDDLTRTDMMLKDFEGVVSPALGVLCVDLIIGSKTLPTTFFVMFEALSILDSVGAP